MNFTEKEMKEFQEEMNELGVFFVSMDEVKGKFGMGIEVDLDTSVDYSDLVDQGLVMQKLTKRKDSLYIVFKEYNKEAQRLTFMVAAPIGENVFKFYTSSEDQPVVGTTFPDFCWYHSEGTTPDTALEVETKFRNGALMGDLTWYLPSRFADNLIEIMHTLNQSFLEGLMQDTIIYGPLFFADN